MHRRAGSLSGLANLEGLDLTNTQITDVGLTHLSSLTKLNYLWLIGTRVTDEGIEKFQETLPSCKIRR